MSLELFDIPILLSLGVFILALVQAVIVATTDGAGVVVAHLSPELSELADEKRRTLASIKTTELDFEAGRIDEADYRSLKEQAASRVIELTKRLDKERQELRFASQVDKELKKLESIPQTAPPKPPDDDIMVDPGWLEETPKKQEKAAIGEAHCPSCGDPVIEGDKFCSGCGASTRSSCPSCGSECRQGAKFCKECGVVVDVPSSPSEVEQ